MIKVVYHLTLGKHNLLTNKVSNFIAIIGLKSKDQLAEVRYLTKDTPAQGKSVNLDKFFNIKEDSVVLEVISFSQLISMYCSFTLFPIELLDILLGMNEEDLSAAEVIKQWSLVV